MENYLWPRNYYTGSSMSGMSGIRTTTSGLISGDITTTTSALSSTYSSESIRASIAAVLPPDLLHLLDTTSSTMATSSSATYTTSKLPSQLSSTISSVKNQLRDDLRLGMDDRRRAYSSSDLGPSRKDGALYNSMLKQQRIDLARRLSGSNVQGSRSRRKGHRRQLSDPKISYPFTSFVDENELDDSYADPLRRLPYKSFEYEYIDDTLRKDILRRADVDPSYMAGYRGGGANVLRDTTINSILDDDELHGRRHLARRYSDGGGTNLDFLVGSVSDSYSSLAGRRLRDGRRHRKARSWHPSPYGSDEDDDQLSREEKKQKIKAEISRRRRQIEENSRLHEELVRLAQLRESAERRGFTSSYNGAADIGDYSGGFETGASVLRSIDDILRDEALIDKHRDPGGFRSYLGMDYRANIPPYGAPYGGRPRTGLGNTEEDRSINRIASTFQADDYTSTLYERLSDFSPLATEVDTFSDFTPHAMPLLPDMPTRSRKILEDLGSTPIRDPASSQGKYLSSKLRRK